MKLYFYPNKTKLLFGQNKRDGHQQATVSNQKFLLNDH